MAVRIKKTLGVRGMTCTHCERVIQDALMKNTGVTEAKASFKEGSVQVVFDSESVQESELLRAIDEAGYEALPDYIPGKHPGNLSSLQLAGVGILIAALYMLINMTIGFNFIPELSASMSYGMLFVVGLLTSLHCIAMCGGINLSQCLVRREDGTAVAGWKPSLLYNGGRVISYTIVGGLVGALGSAVSFSGGARGLIAILAGVFMVIMGINMLGLVPGLRRFNIKIPAGLRNRMLGEQGQRGPLVVGLLNGLMPCGPLQAMQLYALGTGSAFAGAMSMLVFSLGTVPLMFSFGALSTLLSKRFTRNMLKVSAILVVLLGAIMIQRGLSLNGTSVLVLAGSETTLENPVSIAKIVEGVQIVEGELGASSYPEIVVQKGIPVQFNLHAEAGAINGCNKSVLIPNFNIQKDLVPGDNVMTFTPANTGEIGYTCWMGMITSKITVVEDLSQVKGAAPIAPESAVPAVSPKPVSQ